jgi:adenosylmethionine-8-amino-7-oxononanoate aminotransferase
VRDPFWNSDAAGLWRHGYTYSGHATATAAAHPNLDIMEREDLPGRALGLERELADALAPLAEHPVISEVRSGLGVVAAVQPDPALIAADPGLPDRFVRAAREAGVLSRTLVGGGLQISPALTISADELGELASRLAAALDAVAATLPVGTLA